MIRWDLGRLPPPPPGHLDQLEDPAVGGVGGAPGELFDPPAGQCLAAMESPDCRADDGGDCVVVPGVVGVRLSCIVGQAEVLEGTTGESSSSALLLPGVTRGVR